MKRTVSFIIFAVIAVALVWLGVWYDNQSTAQENQAALQQEQAAAQAAAATQTKLMQELTIKDTVVGTGTTVANGDTVSVLYSGSLDNGTVFDASSLHGNQPFSFTVGLGHVIQGWDLGLLGMKVGGTRELTIPPDLGYGANPPQGSSIPANATLNFTIQLLSVSSTAS